MNSTNVCPFCGDEIPAVLYEAHMASCEDNSDTESEGSVLIARPDDENEESDGEDEIWSQALGDPDRFPLPDSSTFTTEGVREQPDNQRGVDPFEIEIEVADVVGAPPEGTKFESDVDDEFMRLVGQLDIDERIVDVNVALLDDMELSKRFSKVKQALLERGEMIDATTQTGRDLHSERGAYLIELRKRGLV